ncbi:response regulator [Moraxella nasovis]|uniref:response regulator n=1 Tax=Moraxella nasovis TaxID=2904121 RepID=UPI001F61B880|nr:response regulator [Moraxella nasovis]UNU73297.1 response regulator [Moraxella nasovis]
MTIKVLVADDHDLVRMGIVRMLDDDHDIEVVAQANDGDVAVSKVRTHRPDVVLLDVNMPSMNGVDATKKIKQIDDSIKILAVSSLSAQPYPSMLLKAGVNGYITKGTPLDEMVLAIKKLHSGNRYFSHDVASELAAAVLGETNQSPFDALSQRERQVAMMVVNCQSAQQIADKLFVSVKTVNTYRYRIFEKLGVDSDVKLTHLAMRYGLIGG